MKMSDILELEEELQNKGKATNMENMDFQNDLLLLKQLQQRKLNEIALWYKAEYNNLLIRHQQKLNKIQIQ